MFQGRNPTLLIPKFANAYANDLEIKKNIDLQTAKSLRRTNTFPSKVFGILKIHPLRLIVDCHEGPTEKLFRGHFE